jgi:chemotaxis signal transduction protein
MKIVDDLIHHMRRVQAAERDLRDLALLWQMIEASSAISCPEEAETILPMLGQTRARFASLQARLVQQLGAESLAELRDELAASGQCTIDILVRNLFERTADVGFLATDDVLRDFCALAPEQQDAERAAIVRRLAEYRAKYSVYDDILLLAPDGRVLVRLDPTRTLERSGDRIVAEASARHGHVEQFACSDLAANEQPALLYGHRVDDVSGRCMAVLVLRFRYVDEMQRIFASVVDADRQVALLLIDADDRVIASNDDGHVPLGVRLKTAAPGEVSLKVFAGREYLCVTCGTHGYQGYLGPGWRAQAMVSLLTAFRGRHDEQATDGAHEQLALDNDELSRIRVEVDAINADLRRVVWNGRLVAGAVGGAQARLKAVLQQINEAGTRTRDRVGHAIRDLYTSSLGRADHQAHELARLAADFMDRNLYERANDCRWWALSPVLERVLAAPGSEAGSSELNAVLQHVNSLYTVYTRLVVFDTDGLIRGVSNDETERPLLGSRIDAALLRATVGLGDSQRYAVSDFGATALSGGAPTYVFMAAVRHATERRVLGGIAIVFNAEREFRAMLDDVLADRAGLAAFVDGQGRVVASTDPKVAIGSPWPLPSATSSVEQDGVRFAVARVPAGGYREFKQQDGYRNDIHAMVALRLGRYERRGEALSNLAVRALPARLRGQATEYALFQIGAGRFALPARSVREARPKEGVVRAPIGVPHSVGLLEVFSQGTSTVIPVICGRSLFGVTHAPRTGDGVVLVLAAAQGGLPLLGLRVDDVLGVIDVAAEHLQDAPAGLRSMSPLLAGLLRLGSVRAGEPDVLVQYLDAVRLLALASPARAETVLA